MRNGTSKGTGTNGGKLLKTKAGKIEATEMTIVLNYEPHNKKIKAHLSTLTQLNNWMNKQIGGKGQLFLTEEFQIINVATVRKIEKHHLNTTVRPTGGF